jgi:hypothetical protein
MREYDRLDLNDVPRRSDEADLLNNAGRNGWVAVTANGIAYFKRKIASPATPARQRAGSRHG